MLYIGIDLGTSAVKLLLMDEKGEVKGIVSREYPIEFPAPGWSQQNPEDWYHETLAGVEELLNGFDKKEVHGISFGGQMHGLVILDEQDQVIRPAILWNDGRTKQDSEYLNQVIGMDQLSSYTANISFSGFTAPKVLWLRREEPENFARINKVMLPKDYLAYRLSGVHCTDVSDASGTLLFDVEHKCWSAKMLDICGLSMNQMAKIYESYQVVGPIKPEVADALGLSHTVKIIAGASDNAAAAVGTGTVGDGMCNISLGTSGTILVASDTFCKDEHHVLHTFAHADGHFHLLGCMLSAASCNRWWMEDILGTSRYGEEQNAIDRLGENPVFFLPYLMGERSPHNDPAARATLIGMSMDTTRADMTQAVLEGVAFGLRESLDIARGLGIPISRTKISGGGAKSLLWKKILANVLNLDVDEVATQEGPSYGAAILAAVGCGTFASVREASSKLTRITNTIHPEEGLVAAYERQFSKFKLIYPAVKDVFPSLQD